MRAAILAGFGVVCLASSARADVELKNDSFNSGDPAGFQGGFVTGEMGAARFVAPDAGRTLLKVQLLYGPEGQTPVTRTITLHVFDDSSGTATPGAELYSGDFSLTASNSAMQEIATTDMQVTVPQQFRVAVEFQNDAAPAIAGDKDGNRTSGRNFIFAIPGGWMEPPFPASALGDWIIRAFVSGTGGMMTGDGGMTTGGVCTGNPDCPSGQFCDTGAGTCTFECRIDEDCGGGICNSLGQCVGDGSGGGCCRTDGGGGEAGALIMGGLFGFLVLRRKRAE